MLRNKKIILFVISLIFSLSSLANSSLNTSFTEANKAYNAKKYQKADSLYTLIESKGYYSIDLFYNLGNTNYKLGKIPETVYYYEKALKLSPGNEEVIHNLKLANKRIADKNTIKTSRRISDVIYSYIKSSVNFWAKSSIIIMIISGLSLILFILIKKINLKKIVFYFAIGTFILGLATIYLSSLQHSKLNKNEHGIIFKPSVELKTEPSKNGNAAFVLHEGTKVKLLSENKEWYEISFDKGQVAWIRKSAIKVF